MNRKLFTVLSLDDSADFFALLICGALFCAGCVVGTLLSVCLPNGSVIYKDIMSYLSISTGDMAADFSFLPVFFNIFKFHFLSFVFGFSILGVFSIPMLSALRGFALAFSVSAFMRILGSAGIPLTLCVFGIEAFISIPCFFVLSTQSFSTSRILFGSVFLQSGRTGPSPYNKQFFKRLFVCFIIIVLLSFVESQFFPGIIDYFVLRIF